MSGTTITIDGNSNASNLVLDSASGSINSTEKESNLNALTGLEGLDISINELFDMNYALQFRRFELTDIPVIMINDTSGRGITDLSNIKLLYEDLAKNFLITHSRFNFNNQTPDENPSATLFNFQWEFSMPDNNIVLVLLASFPNRTDFLKHAYYGTFGDKKYSSSLVKYAGFDGSTTSILSNNSIFNVTAPVNVYNQSSFIDVSSYVGDRLVEEGLGGDTNLLRIPNIAINDSHTLVLFIFEKQTLTEVENACNEYMTKLKSISSNTQYGNNFKEIWTGDISASERGNYIVDIQVIDAYTLKIPKKTGDDYAVGVCYTYVSTAECESNLIEKLTETPADWLRKHTMKFNSNNALSKKLVYSLNK